MTVRTAIGTVPLDKPYYAIGVAARLVDLHPQALRHYEVLSLVWPQRSQGSIRLFPRDIERLRKIARLTQEPGINLAGVEIILCLSQQLEALRAELAHVEALLNPLRRAKATSQ